MEKIAADEAVQAGMREIEETIRLATRDTVETTAQIVEGLRENAEWLRASQLQLVRGVSELWLRAWEQSLELTYCLAEQNERGLSQWLEQVGLRREQSRQAVATLLEQTRQGFEPPVPSELTVATR